MFVNNVQLAQAVIDTVRAVIPLVSKLQSCTHAIRQRARGYTSYIDLHATAREKHVEGGQ